MEKQFTDEEMIVLRQIIKAFQNDELKEKMVETVVTVKMDSADTVDMMQMSVWWMAILVLIQEVSYNG